MLVRFHGAAGEVTGSCHEVEANGHRLLLDCGMIQGSDEDERRNEDPFPFDVGDIDAVVLSHAHIDHSGRLPLLVKRGYRGPIWTEHATADLLKVMLEDSANLAQMDADRDNKYRRDGKSNHKPLFTKTDVAAVLRQVRGMDYEKPREILGGVTLTLRDAGHILGSASVELAADEPAGRRVLAFSGDLGPRGTPILRDPVPVPRADLVLLESTYGGREHRERQATLDEIRDVLEHAWADQGNVIIPAFAVGRSQELLYWFARQWDEWKMSRWKIFLDSPMAMRVVDVYGRHERLFDDDAQAVWNGRPHPFKMPNLQLTPEVAQSQAINNVRGGAIIIAGSGMCNGGRVRHHLRQNLGRKQSHVMFVGYQARGTLGRRLVDGAETVRIFGEDIRVNAVRHTVGGLSAHAGQSGLMDWYGAIEGRPPVVLVHGEDDAREALAKALDKKLGAEASLSRVGMQREV
ncbi:MBL fold metallo-hydrolase [Arenimonas soli]|uniref:MBL fold metallo-hydrolase n=1 Tax=Arenimonas soli TaxID=2269504 RepID=A0ABQ1HIP6_9GAMM|nr:MBL fold metallo-hydrolase [Arenimonas soli]GGA78143.1 MBL fold metallo-hydrolase [Arenimonas soli]